MKMKEIISELNTLLAKIYVLPFNFKDLEFANEDILPDITFELREIIWELSSISDIEVGGIDEFIKRMQRVKNLIELYEEVALEAGYELKDTEIIYNLGLKAQDIIECMEECNTG